MENITAKLKEYLAMDTEIDFNEFQSYYNTVIEKLNKDYQNFSESDLVRMRYVLNTVALNAETRGARKDKNMKKFRKMADKSRFWSDAISHKLKKEFGYTQASLEEADEGIDEEMRPGE